MEDRHPYPTDIRDEEWALVAPYLTLMALDAPQRRYELREIFNALRLIVRAGAPWRLLPNHFPPWEMVYQQTQRWISGGCFELLVHDLREVLRLNARRQAQPSAVIAKRRKGSKVHMAVDTLGHLLALHVTPVNEQDRAQVEHLAEEVQEITGNHVEIAYVDQGYTGEAAESAADSHGIALHVVKLPTAKRGFILLPRRWVVERSFGWAARFRRLARDYERLPTTVAGLHFIAFACLMLTKVAGLPWVSS